MPQLIIQPAGNQGGREHYRDTVETPVPLDRIAPLVDPNTQTQLAATFPSGSTAVWGVTRGLDGGNERKWQRIADGDAAVFLKEGRAYAAGVVACKTHSAALGRELWRENDRGETWEYIYFLKDVRNVDVPYEELNALLGYEPANKFQGFAVVSAERSTPALTRLGITTTSYATRRYWWVNQGTTFKRELDGGLLWAPKVNKSGNAPFYYTNVSRLRAGDLIFHYAGALRAASVVEREPEEARLPEGHPGDVWNADGWLARTKYQTLETPIPLAEIPHAWRAKESEADGSPFNRDAAVKLGYLFPLTDEFANRLLEHFPALKGDNVIEAPTLVSELVRRATEDFERAGLLFPAEMVARFAACLLAKPFVILTGLSGSGKTKLAQAFAHWLGCTSASGRCCVVAVGPDWTSKESALGYANALDPDAYTRTPALDLMLDAGRHPELAHFLILDEMNLSHVERYFADILSTMESGEPIHLHPGPDERQGVPPDIPWPKNVFVVGTVNVDETTYMFSPKVLDRAHVLEFRAGREQMEALIREPRRPDLALVDGLGSRFEEEFVARTLEPLPELEQKRLQVELTLLFDILAHENYEFGYRTAIEVTEFVKSHRRLVGEAWRFDDSVDAEILQKILPRIHGSQRQIEGLLRALAAATFEPRSWSSGGDLSNADQIRAIASEAAKLTDREFDPLTAVRYQGTATYGRSFDKVRRMLRQLDRNGFTSFAEA